MQIDTQSTRNRKIIDFSTYGFNDLQVLGKYNYNKSEDKLFSHVHEGMIEICYYDKGSQFFEVNNEQYLVRGGDVFIHFPGELHGSGGHPEEKGALYWMIVKVRTLPVDSISFLCKEIIEKQKRHFQGTTVLKKKLEGIYAVEHKAEALAIKKIRMQTMVQSFMLSLLDCMEDNVRKTDYTARLDKIFDYINRNITENIAITALASEANLSESRFKGLFKEITGFTPRDYIQRKKVELALERINADPEISFTKLAYELNFSSPQYFSTVMKKYTGKSPGTMKSDSDFTTKL